MPQASLQHWHPRKRYCYLPSYTVPTTAIFYFETFATGRKSAFTSWELLISCVCRIEVTLQRKEEREGDREQWPVCAVLCSALWREQGEAGPAEGESAPNMSLSHMQDCGRWGRAELLWMWTWSLYLPLIWQPVFPLADQMLLLR